MTLNDKDLEKLHVVCLNLLKEVDRICRKNNIEYTLDGGTLLGAVREHGFIPWDDDADIAMTRNEYIKFFNACQNDLDKKNYFLQEYRTDPFYPWGYSKLRMNGTRLVQTGQEHLKFHSGIFIDIFIYDPVPDNFFLRRLHFFICFCIRKCQYAVVGKVNASTPVLRLLYSVLDKIPKSAVFRLLEKMVKLTSGYDSELSSHKTYPYPRKECKYGLPWKCFKEYREIEFENHSFRAIKNFDIYLKMLYGDYMTPPPVSGRKHYPVEILEFNN